MGCFKQSGNHSLLQRHHHYFHWWQKDMDWVSASLATDQSFRGFFLSYLWLKLHCVPILFPLEMWLDTWKKRVQGCDRKCLYSRMSSLVQRKVSFLQCCEEGKTADHVAVTSHVVTLPSRLFSFLFPGQEVRFTMSSCFLRSRWSCWWGRPSLWTAQPWWSSMLGWTFSGPTLANRYSLDWFSTKSSMLRLRLSLFLLTRQTVA